MPKGRAEAHEADDDDDFEGLEPVIVETIKGVIEDNKTLCTMKGLNFGVNTPLLRGILLEAYRNADVQQSSFLRTVKVASNTAAGIIMQRPFDHFSRLSGLSFADSFIYINGFAMNMVSFINLDQHIARLVGAGPIKESQLQHAIQSFLMENVQGSR